MYQQMNTAGCGPASEKQFHGQFKEPSFARGFRRPKYNVPMNIIESDTMFELHVYATGFQKENIKLHVADDMLFIIGTKEVAQSPNFKRQEFPIKNFERSLFLNGQVDIENISAKSENGVLIVTLPKTKESQTKEHKIVVN